MSDKYDETSRRKILKGIAASGTTGALFDLGSASVAGSARTPSDVVRMLEGYESSKGTNASAEGGDPRTPRYTNVDRESWDPVAAAYDASGRVSRKLDAANRDDVSVGIEPSDEGPAVVIRVDDVSIDRDEIESSVKGSAAEGTNELDAARGRDPGVGASERSVPVDVVEKPADTEQYCGDDGPLDGKYEEPACGALLAQNGSLGVPAKKGWGGPSYVTSAGHVVGSRDDFYMSVKNYSDWKVGVSHDETVLGDNDADRLDCGVIDLDPGVYDEASYHLAAENGSLSSKTFEGMMSYTAIVHALGRSWSSTKFGTAGGVSGYRCNSEGGITDRDEKIYYLDLAYADENPRDGDSGSPCYNTSNMYAAGSLNGVDDPFDPSKTYYTAYEIFEEELDVTILP